MKAWTQEEEAQRLQARFTGVNRAEFARTYKVPGGAAMIYQHIQGMRPINLEQAIAYARGFKVPLADISPRLAKTAMEALGVTTRVSAAAQEPSTAYAAPDKFAALHRLPENCQSAILTLANAMLASQPPKVSKKKDLAHSS